MGLSVLVAIAYGLLSLAGCALAATGHGVFAGALLLLATLARRGFGTQRWGPSAFLSLASGVAIPVAAIFASGYSASPCLGIDPIWPAFLAAFGATVAIYSELVFRKATSQGHVSVPFLETFGYAAAVAVAASCLGLLLLAALALGALLWVLVTRGQRLLREDRARPRDALDHRSLGVRELVERVGDSGDDSFFGVFFGQPAALALHFVIRGWRFATPNRITFASLIAGLGGAAFATFPEGAWAAVVLSNLRCALDALDGQVARVRSLRSSFGFWFDKVADAIGWGALYAAVAFRASWYEGRFGLLIPLVAVTVLYFQGITLWVSRINSPASPHGPKGSLNVQRWLKSLLAIWRVEEPDAYLWLSIALLTDSYGWLLWLLVVATGVRVIAINAARALRAKGPDLAKQG